MWIHFTGTAAEKIVRQYEIEPFRKYRISDAAHFFVYAEKIVREFQLHRVGFMNNCNGYLLNILTLVKRRIDAEHFAKNNRAVPDLTLAIEEMQTNFAKNTNISEYAGRLQFLKIQPSGRQLTPPGIFIQLFSMPDQRENT